jgi:hypothetical protein
MLKLPLTLFVVALAIYLFAYYYYSKTSISKFTADPSIPTLKKLYHQRLAEIQDVDKVLDRPITKGRDDIENLTLLPIATNEAVPDLKNDNNVAIMPTASEMILIKKRMKPNTELVKRDNGIFYWDKRFSTEPTPITFAYNPRKFITENPTLFPSYEIYKNNHYFMPKEQRIPV